MNKIIYLGNLYELRRKWKEPYEGMVYDINGLSPTLASTMHKGTMPKILTEDEKS